jgi:transmembrane sensor
MSMDDDNLDKLQREAHDWLARFARGDATFADLEAIKSWYAQSAAHAKAYARARRLWRILGVVARPVGKGFEGQSLGAQPHGADSRPGRVSRRAVWGGVLTASAVAAAYACVNPPFELWPSLAQLRADYRTSTGEQRKIALADNVSLDLNTQTSIAIRSNAAAEYIELIHGEAVVSVAAAPRPLIVSAADGHTIAEDAKFNLRYDRDPGCVVTCLEGTVRVENDGGVASLAAGQQVSYGDRRMGTVAAIDPQTVAAWQNGLLIFTFTPVARAIDEVNRYRPGRIVLFNETIGHRVLNARFEIKDADKIIGQIVRIFGAKATFLPGGLVILT